MIHSTKCTTDLCKLIDIDYQQLDPCQWKEKKSDKFWTEGASWE